MSTVPATLATLSSYLQSQGVVPLGIVGNQSHCTGYHLGRDRIYGACACKPEGVCVPGKRANDYSVQLVRDAGSLTNDASAIDFGRVNGTLTGLRALSNWLVKQCQSNAPGTNDIREIIYSPDGIAVQRWSGVDGLIYTGPGNGDSRHRTHTHISYYRDSRTRDKVALFRAYFEREEDMQITAQVRERWHPTTTPLPDGSSRSNGVLRAIPDRQSPIIQRIAATDHIVTVAEIRTIPGDDGNWRLVEWPERGTLYALRSDWISDGILTEPMPTYDQGYDAAMHDVAAYAEGRISDGR